MTTPTQLADLVPLLFQAHPWHGIDPGEGAPQRVTVYIEIVPTDGVKYELDKRTGHLRIDRVQRYSSQSPTLYGFIPQTYCGEQVGRLCADRTGASEMVGDGDPLDVCILTEKAIPNGNFIARARPIGGLRMIDGREADDKIIGVLEGDVAYGHLERIEDCPPGIVNRLRHYFLSYKQLPGDAPRRVEVAEVYGRAEAEKVIELSMADYRAVFGPPEERMGLLRTLLAR